MAYELLIAEKEEHHLCLCMTEKGTERSGAIGYLRADFGRSGKEFHTTWFDSQQHLKSPDFKHEFDELINSLRDDGQKPPFASRENHLAFCAAHPPMTCFKIATLDYSFYFRLNPHQGTYDIYCFAYDNRYLLPELDGHHRLPEKCFSTLPSDGRMIVICRNEAGYHISTSSTPDAASNRLNAEKANELLGVSKAQEQAMLASSLFGWNKPAANPWSYNQDGTPRIPPKNRSEPER